MIALALLLLGAAPAPARPPITGIDHVAFYTTQPAAAARFWTDTIGARRAADPETAGGMRFFVDGRQYVELLPVARASAGGMVAHVAYDTPDVAAMRRYLVAVGGKAVSAVARTPDGDAWIALRDPQGIEVRFVQPGRPAGASVPQALGRHIIHSGHYVRDRAAEDGFYRRLLGFRPYWYGGMRAGEVDWVSQQVPDGRDWFEYMLAPAGTPRPDATALGGMNHVSLGVASVRATMARLAASGRRVPPSAKPLLGRDGKWQANLLDPDGSRVELMDFQASAAPCCSPFTAPDPRP